MQQHYDMLDVYNQVLNRKEGTTIAQALKEIGIPPATYYFKVHELSKAGSIDFVPRISHGIIPMAKRLGFQYNLESESSYEEQVWVYTINKARNRDRSIPLTDWLKQNGISDQIYSEYHRLRNKGLVEETDIRICTLSKDVWDKVSRAYKHRAAIQPLNLWCVSYGITMEDFLSGWLSYKYNASELFYEDKYEFWRYVIKLHDSNCPESMSLTAWCNMYSVNAQAYKKWLNKIDDGQQWKNIEFWSRIFESRTDELPLKEFCRRNNISATNYYYWKKRLYGEEGGKE